MRYQSELCGELMWEKVLVSKIVLEIESVDGMDYMWAIELVDEILWVSELVNVWVMKLDDVILLVMVWEKVLVQQ